jgi:hypothetical protein
VSESEVIDLSRFVVPQLSPRYDVATTNGERIVEASIIGEEVIVVSSGYSIIQKSRERAGAGPWSWTSEFTIWNIELWTETRQAPRQLMQP